MFDTIKGVSRISNNERKLWFCNYVEIADIKNTSSFLNYTNTYDCCLECGKKAVFTEMMLNAPLFTFDETEKDFAALYKCTCGHHFVRVSEPLQKAAMKIHNIGFNVKTAFDAVVNDISDRYLCLVCVDFSSVYDEKCFFDKDLCRPLPKGWTYAIITDNPNRFTRLYKVGKDVRLTRNSIDNKEYVAEVSKFAGQLERWAQRAERLSPVATLMGWGSFWKGPETEK